VVDGFLRTLGADEPALSLLADIGYPEAALAEWTEARRRDELLYLMKSGIVGGGVLLFRRLRDFDTDAMRVLLGSEGLRGDFVHDWRLQAELEEWFSSRRWRASDRTTAEYNLLRAFTAEFYKKEILSWFEESGNPIRRPERGFDKDVTRAVAARLLELRLLDWELLRAETTEPRWRGAVYSLRRQAERDGVSHPVVAEIVGSVSSVPPKDDTFEDVLSEFDDLVGLDAVRDQLEELVALIRHDHSRAARGFGPPARPRMHLVFVGPPGTGKTTVANRLGKIYRRLGILQSGRVKAVGRAELIGKYIGHSEEVLKKAVDASIGGILFIDEAYSLAGDLSDDARDFGHRVIDILVEKMEAHREDLMVIVAGYEEPMMQFLASNQGLSSRFANMIRFSALEPAGLTVIWEKLAEREQYQLAEGTSDALSDLFSELSDSINALGNARFVEKLFDLVRRRLALRVARQPPGGDEDTILPCDVPGKAEVLSRFPVDPNLESDGRTSIGFA
jgi:DNA polymerase III delta prime subunit